jgi:NAD dependent epimerase/dehydratase
VTALVTGAGGFIGSHLCDRLAGDGEAVRALVRYTSRRDIGNLALSEHSPTRRIHVRFGNLLDPDALRELARGMDTIYHLGASISVPYSYEAPRDFVASNVQGSLNVLAAARVENVGRVVHLSSSEVYGTARYTPIDEAHPLQAQSPYSASKIGADKLAESFHCSFGLPVVTARPFNTFGPRQSPRAVIPTIIAQALDGDTVRIGSTFPRRDFVFVDDTVDALVRLGRSPEGAGEVFNIATGADVSVSDVIDTVGELLGKELSTIAEDVRVRPENSEVHQLLGDASRLTEAFGWRPGHTLREGLARTIDWFRENPRTARVDEYAV